MKGLLRATAAGFVLVSSLSVATAQAPTPVAPMPVDAIAGIIAALRTHDIVALSSPHGNVQLQEFLLALFRDPGFSAAVDDIVLETASARYQDVIDRFVRGEDVSREILRKAWEEHTVPNSGLNSQTEELIRAVRAMNASLGDETRVRLIAGDPPIDWDNVVSQQDHRRWIELRDSYPADVIRRQIVERGRHALVIYGQGHLQRRQIVSNYDMSTWQAQTVESLVERDAGVHVFNVWTILDQSAELPDELTSWNAPSMATLRGTTLGARDFGAYNRGLGSDVRFAVRNDQLVPLPREQWKALPLEEQFDALLYLGRPSSLTNAPFPVALCEDPVFAHARLQRLIRFGPPVEADNFKKACGL